MSSSRRSEPNVGSDDLKDKLAYLSMACANPSDHLSAGLWCETANEGLMLARDIYEQLKGTQEYADEGWAWLGAALHALGVSHVFEIPDWQENLRKSNAEMAAEKAVAASYGHSEASIVGDPP
jgi:hypothetical protein